MSKNLVDLAVILDLELIELNLFRGKSPSASSRVVFGGHVIGQALVSACQTVEGRLPHSLHCCFIRPGDPQLPIIYRVERLRDDKRYSTRCVVAIQHGIAICSTMISFHADEQGAIDHQDKMPDVAGAERLISEAVSKAPTFVETSEFIRRNYGVELVPVECGRYLGQRIDDGRLHCWMKIGKRLPDDPALHACALAYASDYSLLDGVTARHGRAPFDRRIALVSLDHSMWFHRRFRADDWLLYVHESPSAQHGRGLARGLIFTPDGRLVASVAQEGSVRERP